MYGFIIIPYAMYVAATPDPGESFIVMENGDQIITEDGNNMVTE